MQLALCESPQVCVYKDMQLYSSK